MPRIESVALFSRIDLDEALNISFRIKEMLEDRGVKVLLEDKLYEKLGGARWRPGCVFDLLIVVGGDGTILRALHSTGLSKPIFAVRAGLVGFLADCDLSEALEAVGMLLDDKYRMESYKLLGNDVNLPYALNEVRIGAADVLKTVDLEVRVEEEVIAIDRVDALLVATPLGSTGYSLSCGGCILDPRVEAFILTPVSPLTPSFKPYVAPWNSTVEIRSIRGDLYVSVDGVSSANLPEGAIVKVRGSDRIVNFVRVKGSFTERLRRRVNPRFRS
ncbi:MAG: NAD(+)/NADH kinase [Candidatus Bathyarchaeia archaeon]